MRYYSLTISDPTTGDSIVPDGNQGFTRGSGPTFASLYKDSFTGKLQPDPGALNIEFNDIPVTTAAQPAGAFQIKIYGVGLKMIGQAANLAGMNFSLKAGMSPGLPLANPAQAGLIAQGNVYQSFGNWQGTTQTLDLIVNPGTKQSAWAIPIPFFWGAGSSLSGALDNVLSQAFPDFKVQIRIDPRLTLANDEAGYYQSITQFSSYLKGITANIGSQFIDGYTGVDIIFQGSTIFVFDGTQTGQPLKQLAFEDLIGQPTWIKPAQINFKTVLRADIGIGTRIRFPVGPNGSPTIALPYAITSPAAAAPNAPLRSRTVFSGDFIVQSLDHFGNFREPDADSWSTSITAAIPPGSSS